MRFQLNVNGKPVTVDAPEDMPLLWALRDLLHLCGTKYGCGIGMCGSCTVHLNGEATRSCQTTVKDAVGKKITTIEGLAPHPLQRAWQECQVPQCGYCQAGQLMSAAALLKKTPRPTDAQIDTAMKGNLCRCGTYPAIRKAIHDAAANTPLPKPASKGAKK